MITCTPHALLSWTFDLEGDGLFASLGFARWRERGWIQLEGRRLEITKGGLLSGRWTLTRDGEVVAVAKKASPFSRDFDLETPAGDLRLVSEQPYTKRHTLEAGGRVLAKLGPKGERVREATIRTGRDVGPGELDARVLVFAFWLVVLFWRRGHERHRSAGSR